MVMLFLDVTECCGGMIVDAIECIEPQLLPTYVMGLR